MTKTVDQKKIQRLCKPGSVRWTNYRFPELGDELGIPARARQIRIGESDYRPYGFVQATRVDDGTWVSIPVEFIFGTKRDASRAGGHAPPPPRRG